MAVAALKTPRWATPFLKPSRYKGAYGGRGSGKSHFFAELVIESHILDPRRRTVCVREIQKSLNQSVKQLLEDKIKVMGAETHFDVQESCIKSKHSDGVIIFQGMQNHTSDSIKSLEGFDCAWVEESSSLSQHSLDLLRPTIRKPGSEIWFSWNPQLATDPVDLLLRGDDPPEDAVIARVNFSDNPWFPDVLRAEMEYDKRRDYSKYLHVWGGEYIQNSDALVFRNWKIEEFSAPPGATFRLGADWGFANDPSVLVRAFADGRRLYIDYEAHMIGCEIDMLPDLFDRVPDSRKWFITADSSRPETISYMRKHGYPKINQAIKGPRSIEEGIEFLKSYDIVVHPRCEHTIAELSSYSYKVDEHTGVILPVLADKNNHCLVAGTMVRTAQGDKPIEHVTNKDLVMTRRGYKAVLFAGETDTDRHVVTVRTTHGAFTCTPDHEVFTSNMGFVRADSLRYNDEIISFSEDASWSKQSSIKERFTGAIHKAKIELTESTLSGLLPEAGCFYTVGYGRTPTARYLKAGTFTTKMAIPSITQLITSIAYRLKSTSQGSTNGVTRGESSRGSTWNPSATLQSNGILVKKGMQSMFRLGAWLTKTLSQIPKNASNALVLFWQRSSVVLTGSVRSNAKLHIGEHPASMMRHEYARNAGGCSNVTSTARLKLVHGRVLTVTDAGIADKVYDLTVEDQHEFFANGVLVHNCIDSLRYALEGVRRSRPAEKIKVPEFRSSAHGMGAL